jgi:hypothetical protein
VKVGPLDEGLRVIEEGIGPAHWVIVSGLRRVRPGVTVKSQPSAMTEHTGTTTRPAASSRDSSRVYPKPMH